MLAALPQGLDPTLYERFDLHGPLTIEKFRKVAITYNNKEPVFDEAKVRLAMMDEFDGQNPEKCSEGMYEKSNHFFPKKAGIVRTWTQDYLFERVSIGC